jgi:hypothetical protein
VVIVVVILFVKKSRKPKRENSTIAVPILSENVLSLNYIDEDI